MNLSKALVKLTKKELIDLLLELAERDEDVAQFIEFKVVKPKDDVEASEQLIREYMNRYSERGFISWGNVRPALEGAHIVLERGEEKLADDEEDMAIKLGIAVLSNAVDMIKYADDSSGFIGDVIRQSISLINVASEVVMWSEPVVQDQMFELIFKEAMHQRYDGWSDFRHDLLDICTMYATRDHARQKLEEAIDTLIANIEADSLYTYDLEMLKLIRLNIFEVNGEEARVAQYIEDHLDLRSFRKIAILRALEREQYDEALALCHEGETRDQEYPAYVKNWQQYRLKVYEALNDVERQKDLLYELVLRYEKDAFDKLKALSSESEWKKTVDRLFQTFEEREADLLPFYVSMAVKEKRSDKILIYCQQSLGSIVDYYPHLIDDYPKDVVELFNDYIKAEAAFARDRRRYRAVCRDLQHYRQACGELRFTNMIHELKQTYHRRPAFIDELEKLERRAFY